MFKKLFILFLLIGTFGCGNYARHIRNSNQNIKGNPDNSIDFARIKSEILKTNCTSCHRHVGYDSYALVKLQASQIFQEISSHKMPKGRPPLSQEKIQLFADWMAAGAPEVIELTEPQKPETPIDFSQIKKRFLEPYKCIACHSQYNDYGTVKRQLGPIVSLTVSDRMPFPQKKKGMATPVNSTDKDFLLKWVAQEAPEFSNQTAITPVKPELKPNWISLRNQVFGPKCILCHNSYGPRGKGSMATHHDVLKWAIEKPEYFNFKSPIDSHFIGSILGRIDDDEMFFDTMPNNSATDDVKDKIAPVTPEELNVIKEWIELKLPEY